MVLERFRFVFLLQQGQVNNRKRFIDEFREEEHIKSKVQKPGIVIVNVEVGQ